MHANQTCTVKFVFASHYTFFNDTSAIVLQHTPKPLESLYGHL